MDHPSTTASVTSLYRANIAHPNGFDAWLISGCVINWSLLSIMACGMLSDKPGDIALFCLFFVPCGMMLLSLTIRLWHCERAQRTITVWSRNVGSCLAIDVWAAACVWVHAGTESKMWVAGLWFCILPLILLTVNKVAVNVCTARSMVMQR